MRMALDDRDYTKRDSKNKDFNSQQYSKTKNTGKYVDVEDFMQKSYAEAAKKRDANLFTKIKNKIVRLLKL